MRSALIFFLAVPLAAQTTRLRANVPGIFDNSQYESALDARVGLAIDPDTYRLWLTNTVGKRPSGVMGAMAVPSTATAYEANGVSGIILNSSPMTNAVAGSFFAALNATPPTGTVNTVATAVTRLTGPNFNPAWATSVNNLITINGVEYPIASVADGSHLTLVGPGAGTQNGVTWAKRVYVWGINTLLEDGQPGAPGFPKYDWGYLTNEWDFNVFNANTKIVAHSIGGNGSIQPSLALGYTCNTLGTGLKWNYCLGTLDGTASIGVQLGTANTGNNTFSQSITMFARDSSGNVTQGILLTDPSGDWIIRPGFLNPGNLNPQTIFQDGAGNFILGVQGAVGGAKSVVQGGGVTRFQPGADVFANLGAEGSGAMVYCNNCTVANPCASGGSGALAIRSGGVWNCGIGTSGGWTAPVSNTFSLAATTGTVNHNFGSLAHVYQCTNASGFTVNPSSVTLGVNIDTLNFLGGLLASTTCVASR